MGRGHRHVGDNPAGAAVEEGVLPRHGLGNNGEARGAGRDSEGHLCPRTVRAKRLDVTGRKRARHHRRPARPGVGRGSRHRAHQQLRRRAADGCGHRLRGRQAHLAVRGGGANLGAGAAARGTVLEAVALSTGERRRTRRPGRAAAGAGAHRSTGAGGEVRILDAAQSGATAREAGGVGGCRCRCRWRTRNRPPTPTRGRSTRGDSAGQRFASLVGSPFRGNRLALKGYHGRPARLQAAAGTATGSGGRGWRPRRPRTINVAPAANIPREMNWLVDKLYQASSGTFAARSRSPRDSRSPCSVPRSKSPRNASTVVRRTA